LPWRAESIAGATLSATFRRHYDAREIRPVDSTTLYGKCDKAEQRKIFFHGFFLCLNDQFFMGTRFYRQIDQGGCRYL